MVEGGVQKLDKTEFTACCGMLWRQPYIFRLAVSAGIGGFLFGYDTGVISGALLYIRDDFQSVDKSTFLQEAIVSTAVIGAIIGAALGGWMNDAIGRKLSIMIADALFFIGAIVMAVAQAPWIIIIGRVFVGLGVGMASMTAPLYISEASPAMIRGALVSTNGLLITFGQFLSYCVNYAFTKVPGTWRWMLGVAAAPALIQFFLMLTLPESPRYLYRTGKEAKAIEILNKIYPAHQVGYEIEALKTSIETEIAEEGSLGGDGISIFSKIAAAWSTPVVRRALIAGIGLQVAQQFVGINTVMYYSPTIVQLAGFASNSTALALSLITSGLNTLGSIVSIGFVDRIGRRKMLLMSMGGIILCLSALGGIFLKVSHNAPPISLVDTTHFGNNNTCLPYLTAPNQGSWNCMSCLGPDSACGYCAVKKNKLQPGACLTALSPSGAQACRAEGRIWYSRGCPSEKFAGGLLIFLLGAYIIMYSPGMGTVPWIVNSEIYPLKFRGICGGMAAVANWVSNFIVSMSFLSLTKSIGSAQTFWLFAVVSFFGALFIYFFVPETKGLQFEEVEEMLDDPNYKPWKKYSGKN